MGSGEFSTRKCETRDAGLSNLKRRLILPLMEGHSHKHNPTDDANATSCIVTMLANASLRTACRHAAAATSKRNATSLARNAAQSSTPLNRGALAGVAAMGMVLAATALRDDDKVRTAERATIGHCFVVNER
jgi:hypothetical protein